MKKILLLVTMCALTAISYQSSAQQICGTGNIMHWTGAGDPGDMGPGPAGTSLLNPGHVFTIDGNSVPDWDFWISGEFNYASGPKSQYEPNPYLNTLSPANVQIDGLMDGTGADYDRDAVGQIHRDLRYFAFTYDQANIYFFFRRPANNTAQVTLYYFIDINVDGWMANGEPVIQLTFNNSGSSINMGYYEAALPNGYPASAYDPVKGNIMTAPTTRAKTNNTSEWAVEAADGWNLPGNFKSFGNNVTLPALDQVAGIDELFESATLTDNHSDGTDAGYGVEFAVPWKYLRRYNAQGSAGSSIPFGSIFTWHVALVGGQSGISGAEDNAGGCCAGLGISGSPSVNKAATWEKAIIGDPYNYRLNITYSNQKNYPTIITTGNIEIIDPRDENDVPIPENVIKNWTMVGYKNGDCVFGNETTADSTHFIWTNTTGTTYTFSAFTVTKARVSAAGVINATSCYYVNVNAFGWPPLARATVQYNYTTEFDISSNTCDDIQSGTASGDLQVLPVTFLSFNAQRSGSNVNLTWQTATEEANTGFEVQRLIGSGGWQTVTFVPTQAVNGYSNTKLSYVLTDVNTTKGVTQYRLKQIDKNSRAAYSVIRSVRGDGQKGKTIIYPNPSSDGKVNIIFDDLNAIRDIAVTDMSGRLIKQMKAVTNNNIQIDNLNAGFYTVRIVNTETGEQVVEKFVVNKR